jgi:hypothetical protein
MHDHLLAQMIAGHNKEAFLGRVLAWHMLRATAAAGLRARRCTI